MSSDQPESLESLLRALARRVAKSGPPESWPPEAVELLGGIVKYLGSDADMLKKLGYFTIEQACTVLCDLFQKGEVPRVRSFKHCGQEHSFHTFQTYVVCPICGTRTKTSRFYGEDTPEDVAFLALRWLGVDHRSVPGWNPACEWRADRQTPPKTDA